MNFAPNPYERRLFDVIWLEVLAHANISRRSLRELERNRACASLRTAELLPGVLSRLRGLRGAALMSKRTYGTTARARYALAGYLFDVDRRDLESALCN